MPTTLFPITEPTWTGDAVGDLNNLHLVLSRPPGAPGATLDAILRSVHGDGVISAWQTSKAEAAAALPHTLAVLATQRDRAIARLFDAAAQQLDELAEILHALTVAADQAAESPVPTAQPDAITVVSNETVASDDKSAESLVPPAQASTAAVAPPS